MDKKLFNKEPLFVSFKKHRELLLTVKISGYLLVPLAGRRKLLSAPELREERLLPVLPPAAGRPLNLSPAANLPAPGFLSLNAMVM